MSSDAQRRAVTIYDVAARAGVASSTVSRALSRPGRVSAHTAERVRQAVQELGYRRAPMSSALNAMPTRLIAFVVADIANPVFHDVVRGAEKAAEDAGYTVLLVDAQESSQREQRAAEQFLPAVDGLILTSPRLSDTGVRSIAKQRPLITLNRTVRGIPGVLTDGALGARRAAEHLKKLGHSTVAYLAGPESSWADGVRWRGLKEAGEDLGISVRRVGPNVPTITGGVKAAKRWAQSPTSAVFAYNDIMAIGFMRGAQSLGMEVPRDVSIVGFDNSYACQITMPSLTSIASPLREQGATAVNNLIAIINGATTSQGPVLLPVKLVTRDSTGPPSSS